MKKLLLVFSAILLFGCEKEFIEPFGTVEVSDKLFINDLVGIKTESAIVSDEVSMNVKLPSDGTYRIKIRDIGRNLISQEKVQGSVGDNILKVYVNTLENSSYTLELTDDSHKVIGVTSIVVNH